MNRIQERLTPNEYMRFVELFNKNRHPYTIEQHLDNEKNRPFEFLITGAFVFPMEEHEFWTEISQREGTPPTTTGLSELPPDLSNYSTTELLEEVLRRLKATSLDQSQQ